MQRLPNQNFRMLRIYETKEEDLQRDPSSKSTAGHSSAHKKPSRFRTLPEDQRESTSTILPQK